MNITTNKNRILWIDYIKGICMIAVMMNHLGWPLGYARFMYPFELAGFFFAAGYTFNRKRTSIEFIKSKIMSLLLPIMILGTINAIIAYIAESKPLLDRLIGLIVQMPGAWDDLWFVACLFTMELLFYVFTNDRFSIRKVGMACFTVSLASSFWISYVGLRLPWHIENACLLLPFMFAGYVMKHNTLPVRLFKGTIGMRVFCLLFLFYSVFVFVYPNYPIDVHLLEYGNLFVFFISASFGVGILAFFSVFLDRSSLRFAPLIFIGQNTLIYYAFQSKAIRLFDVVGHLINYDSTSYLGNIIGMLFVSFVLVVPTFIINRYFPFILGRFSSSKFIK